MTDRLPPNVPEAERGVLGCCLLDTNKTGEALKAGVTRHWFYDLRNAEIFSVLAAMARNGGGDFVTVEIRLRDAGLLDQIGGVTYLSELLDAVPSAENLGYYIPDLKAAVLRRTALAALTRATEFVWNTQVDAEAVLSDAEGIIHSLRQGTGDSLPPITDAAELDAAEMPEPSELVSGILHLGSKLVLGGGSKSFKTWTLLDLALSVSHGEPWLSFATTKGKTLYLNLELPAWALRQRIAEVAKARSIALLPGQLSVWNLRGRAAGFTVLFPKIKAEIKESGHALIVLDPIYKLYGQTDENSAAEVAALMNAIEDLAVTTGAAVAFGAHFSKGNQSQKESIDRISGSGVFARDPDSILILTKHEEPDAFTLDLTLRNFGPVEPFVVRWQYPFLRRDNSLDPAKLKQAGGRKPEHRASELFDLLPGGGLDNKEWLETARTEQGITERSFYRLRKELESSGKVLKLKTNGKWAPISKQA